MRSPIGQPAGLDVVGNEELWQQGCTGARQHRIADHQQRRQAQDRLRSQDDIGLRSRFYPPDRRRRCCGEHDGLYRRFVAIHASNGTRHAGRRHDQAFIVEEAAADKAFIGRWVDPDDQIIAIFDRIDLAVLGNDLELDLRIGQRKPRTDPWASLHARRLPVH